MQSLPLQLEEGSLRLVLLPSIMLNPQVQRTHQAISCSILLPLGVQEEQSSPLFPQDEALRQPQSIDRHF